MKKVGKLDFSSEEMKEDNQELITRTVVKNTPFEVIGLTDKEEYFAVLGEYRITEKYGTENEAIDEVRGINWNRIIQVMMILQEKLNKQKQ